jgi:hypothetical protein
MVSGTLTFDASSRHKACRKLAICSFPDGQRERKTFVRYSPQKWAQVYRPGNPVSGDALQELPGAAETGHADDQSSGGFQLVGGKEIPQKPGAGSANSTGIR